MRKVIFFFIILFSLSSCDDKIVISSTNEKNENWQIVVYIEGEISMPGIYEIDKNAILNDLINKAGGLTQNADLTNINLLSSLSSGQKYFIPKKENESNTDLININTAGVIELMKLPKIGEKGALNIIEYRNTNGPFLKIEDIKKVSGIKDATFEALKAYITV